MASGHELRFVCFQNPYSLSFLSLSLFCSFLSPSLCFSLPRPFPPHTCTLPLLGRCLFTLGEAGVAPEGRTVPVPGLSDAEQRNSLADSAGRSVTSYDWADWGRPPAGPGHLLTLPCPGATRVLQEAGVWALPRRSFPPAWEDKITGTQPENGED